MDKKKILLIDDDTSLLRTLGDFLKFEGYDVTTATSAEIGLKKLERMVPDLVILDMSMPGMGGVGFLKEVTRDGGRTRYPVLVLTARANMAEFFSDVEVDGFMAKPCDPDALTAEVNRIVLLAGGASAPESEPAEGPRTKKVLIADDDGAAAARISGAFTRAGYAVEVVSKGPDVLEKAIVQKPDIIIIKRVLTNMNGDAVADVLAGIPTTRDIPIVLYDESGSQFSEARFAQSVARVRKFVRSKDPEDLLAAADDVVGPRLV